MAGCPCVGDDQYAGLLLLPGAVVGKQIYSLLTKPTTHCHEPNGNHVFWFIYLKEDSYYLGGLGFRVLGFHVYFTD
jgi:hypothetical protein